VVGEVISLAERTLRPCVVVARTVEVSSRELRTFGAEIAYALGGGPLLDAAELTARAAGMAGSWTW
jgi:alcohol dehydrogenase class IV